MVFRLYSKFYYECIGYLYRLWVIEKMIIHIKMNKKAIFKVVKNRFSRLETHEKSWKCQKFITQVILRKKLKYFLPALKFFNKKTPLNRPKQHFSFD